MYRLLLILVMSLLWQQVSWAKTLSLYDQPQANAKIIGTVDTDAGINPIYTPKGSQWVKVADPRNGNVGWVKASDLANVTQQGSYTFTQKIISTGNGPNGYIIQYGMPQQLTPEQTQALMKQMQMRQEAIQKATQQLMQSVATDWNQQMTTTPVIMPIIVMPAENPPAPPASGKK